MKRSLLAVAAILLHPEAMPVNVPTNLLRSFVAIVDSGSMLSAADHVFVSQSGLSLQLKRLEDLVQQPLFVRDGRRLVLTEQGAVLLGYARRLLALHDEAVSAVAPGRFVGPLRIGMVQDFAEVLLPGLLARFAELHPDVDISARITGTTDLVDMIDRGALDVILGYAQPDERLHVRIAPMRWHGDVTLANHAVVPLAVLEKPCRFRDAAIASLEAAGRDFRLSVETPSVSSLRAAVQAGLGVTCRTALFLEEAAMIPQGLPPLPSVAFIVRCATEIDAAAKHLAQLATEAIVAL